MRSIVALVLVIALLSVAVVGVVNSAPLEDDDDQGEDNQGDE